jgi:hypothetical protein
MSPLPSSPRIAPCKGKCDRGSNLINKIAYVAFGGGAKGGGGYDGLVKCDIEGILKGVCEVIEVRA